MKKLVDFILPIFAEKVKGSYKLSIGRFPLFLVCMILCYRYAVVGEAPPEGILMFIGMALGYNGTKWFSPKQKEINEGQ